MIRYMNLARLVGALVISAMCVAPAGAQAGAGYPVYDAAAVTNLAQIIATQQQALTNITTTMNAAISSQKTLTNQWVLMNGQVQTSPFNSGQLASLISTFKTATSIPNILAQNAGQTVSIVNQFQKLFPGYTAGSSFADYANTIASTTAAAQQNTLAQAAQYNTDFGTTQSFFKNLQSAPPTTELEALRVTSVLLQQDIEQVGKMGALLSSMSQSMGTYYGREVALQSAAQTRSCESSAHVVYERALQVDPTITMAQVQAALAGTQNCANNAAP